MTYRYFRLAGGANGDWPFDHPVQIGTILRIRIESGDALPGSAWNESTKEWVEPKWVEVGDPASGVRIPSPTDWDALLTFIGEREHNDDWGVPCVYTKDLRALIEELRTGVPATV